MICKAFLERSFSTGMSDRARGSSLLLSYLMGEENSAGQGPVSPRQEQADPAGTG